MKEQATEFRIRKVTSDKFDLVLMNDDSVEVRHNLSYIGVMDYIRAYYGSLMYRMQVGGSYNMKSLVKF